MTRLVSPKITMRGYTANDIHLQTELTIYTAPFHSSIRGNRTDRAHGKDENGVGDQKLNEGGQQTRIAHDES